MKHIQHTSTVQCTFVVYLIFVREADVYLYDKWFNRLVKKDVVYFQDGTPSIVSFDLKYDELGMINIGGSSMTLRPVLSEIHM